MRTCVLSSPHIFNGRLFLSFSLAFVKIPPEQSQCARARVHVCVCVCVYLILVQHLLLQFLHQLALQVDLIILHKHDIIMTTSRTPIQTHSVKRVYENM